MSYYALSLRSAKGGACGSKVASPEYLSEVQRKAVAAPHYRLIKPVAMAGL
jgi:hypothetical protein